MLHCVFVSYNPLEIGLLSVFHQSEVFKRVEDGLMQSRSKASVKLDVYPCFDIAYVNNEFLSKCI